MRDAEKRSRRLTDAMICGLRAPDKGQVEVPDEVVVGLRLRLSSGGARTWCSAGASKAECGT